MLTENRIYKRIDYTANFLKVDLKRYKDTIKKRIIISVCFPKLNLLYFLNKRKIFLLRNINSLFKLPIHSIRIIMTIKQTDLINFCLLKNILNNENMM